ncbi:hypothetical protein CH293_02135 [Rhodococcus sp. 14-2470-1b]|uniref:hypothetical protein n=1 Tax=Rhodococcus sp. 14-2470-1b TaxID=2023149 RepID=UPI000B9BFA1C|nr:hypothetical protein [Rhodococcus sp. 14-2470-1b]OZF57546.1 hypothetical protein CH293_02135 [Rhodococcus sp. 14-2470-1b]
MTATIGHVLVGPPAHGVVEYGASVARELGEPTHRVVRLDGPESELPAWIGECSLVHLHVTDRLFGDRASAEPNYASLCARLPVRHSVTVHDVPQPSDGSGFEVRIRFYRNVIHHAAGVIVSSEHEASLLREFTDAAVDPQVVPLMMPRPRAEPAGVTQKPRAEPAGVTQKPRAEPAGVTGVPSASVAVLGFLYPGKGHIETLRAMADLPRSVGFVALGTASPGHEDLIDQLRCTAAEAGRPCEVTGFLPECDMYRRLADATVPVAFHRHLSASGSINTWIAARRRPLVPRNAYTEELDLRSPGVVRVHEDDVDSLRDAIAEAVRDPSSTWIDADVVPRPTPSDVAREYDSILRGWQG